MERVLRERFRIDAKLLVAYKETDQEGTREYDEQRIQQEINAIFERRARQRGEEPERAAENQEIGSDTKKRQAEPGEKAAGGKEKAAARSVCGGAVYLLRGLSASVPRRRYAGFPAAGHVSGVPGCRQQKRKLGRKNSIG